MQNQSLDKKRLDGKVALVTGAAQGIGKTIANVFAREGARVILVDTNDQEGHRAIEQIQHGCSYMHLDVQEELDWRSVTETILKRFGKLNVLVNNAGITGFNEDFGPQDPENASFESWKRVFAVNSDSVFLACKYSIPIMKSSGGSIINISSRSGIVGVPGAAAYAASKAAVRNHTKSVALYCCQQGYKIRCNSIHPAAILTPMWGPMLGEGPEKESRMQQIVQDIPMKKMGTTEDVALAALFLASAESDYITGIELTVDGGILAGASSSPNKA